MTASSTASRTTSSIASSAEANTAIVRRLIEAAWNRGDEAAVDALVDARYVGTFASHPEPLHGPAAFRRFVGGFRSAFPDLHFTPEDVITTGDRVVVRWTVTGTHRGDLMGIPGTGKRVASVGIWIHRLAGGKIVEQWGVSDMFGLLIQLGLLPPPGAPAAKGA
jgi:steroid delta-isomerase-like uncharacterized protein